MISCGALFSTAWRWLAPAVAALPLSVAQAAPPAQVRLATFNASLNRTAAGQLFTDLSSPAAGTAGVAQAKRIAEIIQRTAPDIILVNEFDYDTTTDAQGRTVLDLFHDNFLAVPQQPGLTALNYPYRYTAPSNTGVHSGFDLDNSGGITTTPGSDAYGNDCFGFGQFPGQYGMAVYSRFPIQTAAVRTFRNFLWRDMPGALLPDNATTLQPKDWYSDAELAVVRLSSKSHWDLPIDLGRGHTVHFLAAHPTPPVFDGTEDRNGKRNHNEIRFWADYLDPLRATYHRDDAGVRGGLPAHTRFFIAGDHNADPLRGDSVSGAAQQYTTHPLINNTVVPSAAAFGNNTTNTADFSPLDLRVDYALPSKSGFTILGSGIYWPVAPHAQASLVTNANASDHRLVWMDLQPVPILALAVQNLDAIHENGSVRISFRSSAGHTYLLEETTAVHTGPWTAVPNAAFSIAPDGTASVTVPVSIPGRRYYRVVVGFAP
jgi:3-phytase